MGGLNLKEKQLVSTLSKTAYALISDENVIILRKLGFSKQCIDQLKGDLMNMVITLEGKK